MFSQTSFQIFSARQQDAHARRLFRDYQRVVSKRNRVESTSAAKGGCSAVGSRQEGGCEKSSGGKEERFRSRRLIARERARALHRARAAWHRPLTV